MTTVFRYRPNNQQNENGKDMKVTKVQQLSKFICKSKPTYVLKKYKSQYHTQLICKRNVITSR